MSLMSDSPARPVNWRWLRAKELNDNRQASSRRRDDAFVVAALQMIEAQAAIETPDHRYALEEGSPDLYRAWELAFDTAVLESTRAEIEARLLAGQGYAEAGRKVRYSAKTVQAYEAWFFNVTDRLGDDNWVVHQAFGRDYHRGVAARDYDVLWKVFGYFGGPHVLDAYIRQGVRRPATRAEDVSVWFQNDERLMLTIKAAVAARTVSINGFTQVPILDLSVKHREIDLAREVQAGGAETDYVSTLKELVSAVVWKIAGAKVGGSIGYAVEPRADELLAIAARGQEFDWSQAKIPEVADART